VLVFATLGAPERRWLRRSDRTGAESAAAPAPVATGRVTLIDVGAPLDDERAARGWLDHAGEDELGVALGVIDDVLHTFRLITADPYLHPVGRSDLLVARIGFGDGEQVADGRWLSSRELQPPRRPRGRAKVLEPQARLAAALGAREPTLVCEELALRAQLDVDHGRWREAALQILVALDSAIAELSVDARGSQLARRIEELRGQRAAVGEAAQTALAEAPSEQQRTALTFTLGRIEAALRARAVANA
jgi:hypothetical protein